jgi:hypothetical protein
LRLAMKPTPQASYSRDGSKRPRACRSLNAARSRWPALSVLSHVIGRRLLPEIPSLPRPWRLTRRSGVRPNSFGLGESGAARSGTPPVRWARPVWLPWPRLPGRTLASRQHIGPRSRRLILPQNLVIGGPSRRRSIRRDRTDNVKDSIADLFRGAKMICVPAAANAKFFAKNSPPGRGRRGPASRETPCPSSAPPLAAGPRR